MINVQAAFLSGFAQNGVIRVMDVNVKTTFETNCDKVLEPKWTGKTANGEAYEGNVGRIIEKPGFGIVAQIRERSKLPQDENSLEELCFYVAIQGFPGYPKEDPNGSQELWQKAYDFYVQLKRAKSYVMCFSNYSLMTSDQPVQVDPNSDSLYFPIQHNMAVVFRHKTAPQTYPTPARINSLMFRNAKKFVMYHPKSDFGSSLPRTRTL